MLASFQGAANAPNSGLGVELDFRCRIIQLSRFLCDTCNRFRYGFLILQLGLVFFRHFRIVMKAICHGISPKGKTNDVDY